MVVWLIALISKSRWRGDCGGDYSVELPWSSQCWTKADLDVSTGTGLFINFIDRKQVNLNFVCDAFNSACRKCVFAQILVLDCIKDFLNYCQWNETENDEMRISFCFVIIAIQVKHSGNF